MFDGFSLERVSVDGVGLRVRHGGDGPPVLLLHGHPRTHATWHRVAPLLVAAGRTVVCPDLRGYGESDKPATSPDHAPYSKRAMAADCVGLMRHLGHERFAVVGHDRGSYVAFRTAMDHPDAVTHLAVLESVPIGDVLARCDARFAHAWYHWFWLGNPVAGADRMISADPDAWYGSARRRAGMGDEPWFDWMRAIHDPATVTAMCEDYRAGLGIDREHDEADRAAGRRVQCPVLAVWSTGDDLPDLFGDVTAIWRGWADDVRGAALDCGHHQAEEVPDDLARRLVGFFGAAARAGQAAGSPSAGRPPDDPGPDRTARATRSRR